MILFNFFVCSHRICTFIALYTLSELSYSCRACEKSILSTLLSQCPAKSIKLIALSVTVLCTPIALNGNLGCLGLIVIQCSLRLKFDVWFMIWSRSIFLISLYWWNTTCSCKFLFWLKNFRMSPPFGCDSSFTRMMAQSSLKTLKKRQIVILKKRDRVSHTECRYGQIIMTRANTRKLILYATPLRYRAKSTKELSRVTENT